MDIRAHMQAKLTELDYDFSRFTIEGFARWLGEQRGRKILLIPWSMPAGVFGAWISDADEPFEYIFYDEAAMPLHQTHIKLHELSHIICGHPTLRLSNHEIKMLLQGDLSNTSAAPSAKPALSLRAEGPQPEGLSKGSGLRPTTGPSSLNSVLLRSTHPAEMDTEAEIMATLVQEQVLRFSTLERLTATVSSDEDIAKYMRAMELV